MEGPQHPVLCCHAASGNSYDNQWTVGALACALNIVLHGIFKALKGLSHSTCHPEPEHETIWQHSHLDAKARELLRCSRRHPKSLIAGPAETVGTP